VCTSWIEGVHTASVFQRGGGRKRYGCEGALARMIRLLRGRGASLCVENGGKEAVRTGVEQRLRRFNRVGESQAICHELSEKLTSKVVWNVPACLSQDGKCPRRGAC
jgi:hypothetical protein